MEDCQVTYAGPSYPWMHGSKCIRAAPHEGVRHLAVVDTYQIQWWTPEEKEAIRLRDKEKNNGKQH